MGFFQSQAFFVGWLITGSVSFAVLVGCAVLFGKLFWLQCKNWILASRGYHMIEHIGLDRVRNYYYLKPNEGKFDFTSGYYLHQKDATTKIKDGIIPSVGQVLKMEQAEAAQYKNFEEKVTRWMYVPDAVTLRWGIPCITYVANNPYPVDFFDLKSKKSAQIIADMYLRMLATQRYKDMMKMLFFGILAIGATAIVLFLVWRGQVGANQVAGNCVNMWNATQQQLVQCVNMTARVAAQNSTVVI